MSRFLKVRSLISTMIFKAENQVLDKKKESDVLLYGGKHSTIAVFFFICRDVSLDLDKFYICIAREHTMNKPVTYQIFPDGKFS